MTIPNELDPSRMFRERLAQFLDYMGASGGSEVLEVSFQFLANGKDNEIEQVVGMVEKSAQRLFRAQSGGRFK
jgi:hypothetical protein